MTLLNVFYRIVTGQNILLKLNDTEIYLPGNRIVREPPALNDPSQGLKLADQAESIRYLSSGA